MGTKKAVCSPHTFEFLTLSPLPTPNRHNEPFTFTKMNNISAISSAVKKYDDSLQQIAQLKRENNNLKTVIRTNDIKAMKLIDHYKQEIESQTKLVINLKDELRARERMEILNRQRNYRDQCTWIEEQELQTKEDELLKIIYLLEDEIATLKEDLVRQKQDFERKQLINNENVKQSFMKDIDVFRSQISNDVCDEVREALADTLSDNERLTSEFRLLLNEMHNLQKSRDEKANELSRAKRELQLAMQKNKMMGGRITEQIRLEQERCAAIAMQSESSSSRNGTEREEVDGIVEDGGNTNNTRKATVGSTLEDYFKQCIKNAQRTSLKSNSRMSM